MSPEGVTPYELHQEPVLDNPVLVVALEGWVDAGLGAAAAITTLLEQSNSELVATFNGPRYIDQRARRPVAHIVDGITTSLGWPRTELRCGQDRHGSDMLFLVGPEPDFYWQEFVDAVVELVVRLGARMVVGLGAFPARAPHTRPVKLAATAPPSSSELVSLVGVVQGEFEVPAGVVSALEMGFDQAGISAVSLWARVPHYVSGMPFPEAGAALIDGLVKLTGVTFDSMGLYGAGDNTRHEIDQLVSRSVDHQAMVRELEESVDEAEGNALGLEEVPSGDEIAAELERFLRDEPS
jgi:predicted ATP-grasp superfamily ATP-dependent carboligase